MKRIGLTISIVISFVACRVSEKTIIGSYSYTRIYGVNHKLIFKKDSTFSYCWQDGLNSDSLTGKWSLDKRFVYLNSSSQAHDQIITVHEGKTSTIDTKKIKVIDMERNPLSPVYLRIDQSELFTTNFKGELLWNSNKPISRIEVSFLGFEIPDYTVQDSNSNYFEIQLNLNSTYNISLTNEKIRVKKNKMIWKDHPLSNKTLTLISDSK